MKKSVIALLGASALMVSLSVADAYAESGFYVEIGKDTTQDEAKTMWDDLVTKHKALLGRLKFYPKSVYEGGVAVSTRIQAGPIANKNKAQKICKSLFTDDVPCFVIEGVEDAPPTAMMNLSEKTEEHASVEGGLPWAHSSEVGEAVPVRGVTLPWLAQHQEEQVKKQAEVQVAEAIRVPLSDNTVPKDAKVTVKSLAPEPKPTFRKPLPENKQAAAEAAGAGWLTINSFANEDIATAFWDEARTNVPKKQAGSLRVRVNKALMTNQGKATLSVGPFASSTDAYALCDKIQASARGLSCSYMGNDTVPAAETQYAHAEGYAARRTALENSRAETLGTIAPAAGPSKQYWVQVVQASSQMEALNKWDTMRSGNTDLLNGMRSSVSTSASDKSSYVVRVGPIAGNDDAVQLCSKLQGRGIECKVLLYSMGM